jgi:hexosaminidase
MSLRLRLLPAPRTLRDGGSGPRLGPESVVSVQKGDLSEIRPARERIQGALRRRSGPGDGQVELAMDPGLPLPSQGYELRISKTRVRLEASDRLGLCYGTSTLEQILAQSEGTLPGLEIEDSPAFARRGYMLDISRDRVPTQESLLALVPLLARLRINELQLYTEHSFAYSAHRRVWADASPMTPDQIRELDAHCAEHQIELVPNQNSFGHMERWLRHPEYRWLAERPEGGPNPPSCLAPGDQTLQFMRELYEELLPCFRSRRINIGCDETWELGQGRSQAVCERLGRGRVYLNHVNRLIEGLHAQGRTVQVWGDIVRGHPELIPDLPTHDFTALAWGYEAPSDPARLSPEMREDLARLGIEGEELAGFEGRLRPFAEAAVPFYVCPGTSSWNSLVGRLPNALANLEDAALAGLSCGAEGFLITDWGDNGHLQPPCVSLPPLCYGAALAWDPEANRDLELKEALRHHVLPEEAPDAVSALLRLGSCSSGLELECWNASPLFAALTRPLGAELRVWGRRERARIEATIGELETCLELLTGASRVERELRQAARLARHGAWRLAQGFPDLAPRPEQMRADLEDCIDEQARVWLEGSRPGGLDDSLSRLRRALGEY